MTLRTRFQGMYQSSWRFLVIAARSNLSHAAGQTYRLVSRYARFRETDQDKYVTYLIMTDLYKCHLAGPLLGTILAASAAVETFLRMAMRAFLEKDRPKQQQARGPSPQILKKLEEFDGCTLLDKLDHVSQALLQRNCQDTLRNEFKALVNFRNECFHSDAILRRQNGEDQTTKRGWPKHVSPKKPLEYPFLWASNRPLSLAHALRVVRLHDDIVKELVGDPIPQYLDEFFEFDGVGLRLDLIEAYLRKPVT